MCCKLSSKAAQGISSQTLTWRHRDLRERGGGKSTHAWYKMHHAWTHLCWHARQAHIRTRHYLYGFSPMTGGASQTCILRAGCKRSVSRLCEQSTMKSHIPHISLLPSALPPNTVFNKHSKTASRQYWNDSMSLNVCNIIEYVERWVRAQTHTIESLQLRDDQYLLAAALLILSYSFVLWSCPNAITASDQ